MSKGNRSNHNEIAATAWRQRNADWWSEIKKAKQNGTDQSMIVLGTSTLIENKDFYSDNEEESSESKEDPIHVGES